MICKIRLDRGCEDGAVAFALRRGAAGCAGVQATSKEFKGAMGDASDILSNLLEG